MTNEKFCQRCAMPLENAEEMATNVDESRLEDRFNANKSFI